MHVETHEMADAVDEVLGVARFLEYTLGHQVQVIVVIGPDLDVPDRRVRGLQHELVEFLFPRRELSTDRESAGYVGSVVLPGGTGVDQYETVFADGLVILAIMQDRGIWPGGEDGGKAEKLGAGHLVLVFHNRLQLELLHARLDRLHRGDDTPARDIDSFLNLCDLQVVLDTPHFGNQIGLVLYRAAGYTRLGSPQELELPGNTVTGADHRTEEHGLLAALQRAAEESRHCGRARNRVEARSFLQRITQRCATAIPVFHLGVARLQVQHFLVAVFARRKNERRTGFRNPREVVEIRFLDEVGLDDTFAGAGAEQDGNAAVQRLHQGIAASLEYVRVGFACLGRAI